MGGGVYTTIIIRRRHRRLVRGNNAYLGGCSLEILPLAQKYSRLTSRGHTLPWPPVRLRRLPEDPLLQLLMTFRQTGGGRIFPSRERN